MDSNEIRGKRPPTAFQLFCRDQRSELCQKCPRLKSQDITALLSHLWRKLDNSTRKHYRDAAACQASHNDEVLKTNKIDGNSNKARPYFPLLEPENGELTERRLSLDSNELSRRLAFPFQPIVLKGIMPEAHRIMAWKCSKCPLGLEDNKIKFCSSIIYAVFVWSGCIRLVISTGFMVIECPVSNMNHTIVICF